MWPILASLAWLSQQAPVPEGAGPAVAPQWPAPVLLRILRPLEIRYPLRALMRHQEGGVTAEILVGLDGVPRDCRIVESSGHQTLDTDTCNMFLQARFAPPKNAQGENVETSFAQRVMWVLPLARRRSFVASGMTIEMVLAQGQVTACRVSGDGPLFPDWRKIACSFATHVARRVGDAGLADGQWAFRVSMGPSGSAPAAPPLSSGSIGRQELEFELSGSRVTGCRSKAAGGMGVVSFPEGQLCEAFASDSFLFERPENRRQIRRGTLIVDLSRRGPQ